MGKSVIWTCWNIIVRYIYNLILGYCHITIKLRKANTPKRENWHFQMKMYNFLFWGRY